MCIEKGHSSALLCYFDTFTADLERSHRAAMKVVPGTKSPQVPPPIKLPESLLKIDHGYARSFKSSPTATKITSV